MVIKLLEKPEGILKDVKGSLYFEFTYNDDPYAYFAFQIFGSDAAIHCDVVKWTHNIAKAAKEDFKYLEGFLKHIGIDKISAFYHEDDKKWVKFIKMFGLPQPKQMLSSTKEI